MQPAPFGAEMREHYEQIYQTQERENQRLREEAQRLREELRDERDRAHRERMEAMVEQMRSEAKEMRERFKLREEMIEMKGELYDARAGRDDEGALARLFERHGDRFFDLVEGAVGGVSGLLQLAAPPSEMTQPAPVAQGAEAQGLAAERENPEELSAWLGNVIEEAAWVLTDGTPEQVTEASAALSNAVPEQFRLAFARGLLLRLAPEAPEAVAGNLRMAIAAVAPNVLHAPIEVVLNLSQTSGVVATEAEAAWLKRVLALVQGGASASAPPPAGDASASVPPPDVAGDATGTDTAPVGAEDAS